MMSKTIVFPLFGYDYFAQVLHQKHGYEIGVLQIHRFPDEEMVARFETEVQGKEVILIGSLDRPDSKILPLIFAAQTARELGATKIGLIAPYLAYMRQDKQFNPGEGVTSKYFAALISGHFDWIKTIDPHLHRWPSLDSIYTIPAYCLHAFPCIVDWIKNNVSDPVFIGPDEESEQWVESLAQAISSPFVILKKIRKGDENVEVSMPELEAYRSHTPVIVDDIISSGVTMIETIKRLHALNMKPPVCIGIHAVFANNSYKLIQKAGVNSIVTCNTIMHETNKIDISSILI